MSRHIICLVDGTRVTASSGQQFSSYSNVYELAYTLQLRAKSEDGREQIVFYSSGIASQPGSNGLWNAATGKALRAQVLDQYTNLCSNYDFEAHDRGRKRDKIYLFGFSRGAMAVRALAALIMEYGLLRPKDVRYAPQIISDWEKSESRPDVVDPVRVEVEFIGVFDSVMGGIKSWTSLQPIRFPHYNLHKNCVHAVHILAIDENRRLFQNRSWDRHMRNGGSLRQIWMPGVHADIGGIAGEFWGRISFLTMAYYIDTLTPLLLEQSWIRAKISKVQDDLDGRNFRIDQHHTLPLLGIRRSPWNEPAAMESVHPVIDLLPDQFRYNGRPTFPWKKNRFGGVFDAVAPDEELADYFRGIFTPQGDASPATNVSA